MVDIRGEYVEIWQSWHFSAPYEERVENVDNGALSISFEVEAISLLILLNVCPSLRKVFVDNAIETEFSIVPGKQ